jgi:predicted Fe-Mo cluster-binding NifX family protein
MRVAIAQWQGRISPVFDVSSNLVLVDCTDGLVTARVEMQLDREDPRSRALTVTHHRVSVLICGAISREYAAALRGHGIRIIAEVCGEVETVLAAFIRDELDHPAFRMPGSDTEHANAETDPPTHPQGAHS